MAEDLQSAGVKAEETEVQLPEPGELASRWDANVDIRQAMRDNKKLLVWPSVVTTGVASLKSLSLNRLVVSEVVHVWSGVSDAKSPPIGWLRDEARAS